ncbi:ABC transporter permease [Candidatus Venteria ishoeyi]|uniref:ABC transporter permease n=1 Tax=Candidatus Venteria ishoeyi TaxID=1899563 RepID=UPI0015B2B4E5|nr:ABC transporter permease [Candidatus Venteria ishoeyi]
MRALLRWLLRWPLRFSGWLGHRTVKLLLYLLDFLAFFAKVLSSWRSGVILDPTRRAGLLNQLIHIGLDSLPVIGLLAFAVGLSIAYQILSMLRLVGEPGEVVAMLVQIVALEIGSLLTAMVLIGRATSSITMDLGNMELRREIEAVELLGVDIYDFFITPRLLGTALSQLVLSIYFSLIALVSGIMAGALLISPGVMNYLLLLPYAFHPFDVMLFVLKNLLYGFIIGTAACFHALRVHRSPAELLQQARQAYATSLSLVFLLDGIIALL